MAILVKFVIINKLPLIKIGMLRRSFSKIKPYIFPFLILIGLSIAAYFLVYLNLDVNTSFEKSLALLLSVAGLIFGIFQVVLNLKIQGARNRAQLRHSEYKELVKILNSISELLNEHMIKELNIHGLLTSLLNRRNEFISFMSVNNNYLFSNIQNKKAGIETREELYKIYSCTEKLRIELEKSEKEKVISNYSDIADTDTDKAIMIMNWHNEVREHLKRYSSLKYELLKEVQAYI